MTLDFSGVIKGRTECKAEQMKFWEMIIEDWNITISPSSKYKHTHTQNVV